MAWGKKEQQAFQKEIRSGLERTAHDAYRKRLAEINEEAKKQRSECSQELHQVVERLDQAVTNERAAVAEARADQKRAAEARAAAAHRLRVAEEVRRAKATQKKKACKVEADALRERRAAEKAHRAEMRAIDRSIKARKKPLAASAKERKSETHDEVEGNLSSELVPLWRQVRRTFKVSDRGEGRQSLTEAFERYAAEHPDEVIAAREDDAARGFAHELAAREREERKRRGPRKTHGERGRGEKRRRAAGDEERVPF